MHIQLKPPIEVGTGPSGMRLIWEIDGAKINGERLSGEMAGSPGGDWALLGPDGTTTLDVRWAIRTDDGAIIFMEYRGRADTSQSLDLPLTIYVAPLFETADERYLWLNRTQAVGKGVLNADLSIDYEWYEVR
jgi:hypothetical protein